MIPMPEPRDVEAPELEQAHHGPRLMANRPLPVPIAAADGESSFDLRRIAGALKYHWFLFLVLGSLLGAGLGAAAWELLPAKYTTTALLRVNSSTATLLGHDPQAGRSEFLTFLRTQADAIRSENVLRAALRDSKIGSSDTLKRVDDPVRWMQENILVEFSEHSELMKVTMTGENPQEMADIINAVDAAYMKEVVMVDQVKKKSVLETLLHSRQQMEETVKNLKVQLELKRKKPNAGEAAAAAPGTETPPLKAQVGTAEFARMNEEYRRAEMSHKLGEQHLQMLKARRDKADTLEVSNQELDDYLSKDPDLKALKDKAERVRKHWQFLQNSYASPTNPDVLDARQRVDAADAAAEDYRRAKKTEIVRQYQNESRRRIDQAIDQSTADLASKDLIRKSLKQQLDATAVPKEAVATAVGGPALRDKNPADYDMDESSLIYAIGTYEDLLKHQNQESVEAQASRPRVDEWQKASVPIKKEMKKQIVFSLFAVLLGFAAVGACVTMYEGKINRLFGVKDLADNPAMNVIGVLPEIGSADPIAAGSDAARLKADPFMEGVEKVRLMLGRNFLGKRTQTILISSAASGEGKTTLAGHLAVSMTRADRKTILVDANLRSPGMHEHLGLTAQPGVCELLRGDSAIHEVVQRTAVGNLWFLPAGAWDAAAQQALGRDRFRRVLDKLRQEFDFIIIDSHDLSTVADTYQIGMHCDAVVVCARRFVSRKPLVEQAYRKVCELGVPHAGLIFLGESK